MKKQAIGTVILAVTFFFAGCGQADVSVSSAPSEENQVVQSTAESSDMFTDRDKKNDYDEESSVMITLSDNGSDCDSNAVSISENTITIADEGTYILSGNLTDGMVIVEAEESDKIQLVLDGVEITSSQSAAIYVRSADKVFITTASDSENSLSNGGTYTAIDENNIDAVIFSKSDLTLNGTGTLKINAQAGHGIVSKDDLVLTGGTYDITAEKHGLSGKDSVRIADGTYTITCGKDGLHASNEDDTSKGFIYMEGGNFRITAEDDGIHADSSVTIYGGTIDIVQSYEGIEGLTIDIAGGNITLAASDDGLNAAGGNDSSGFEGPGRDQFASTEGAYIHISGGTVYINASGDGIDSNGDLTVSGGETYVSGPVNSGNGALDYSGNAVISGGIFVAAGSSGMAQNFGESSSQGVIMVNVNSQKAGSLITLSDSDGNELLSWQADKEYSSVIISCPKITLDQTYSVTAGDYSEQITMDNLVYGNSGMGGNPGMDGQMKGNGGPMKGAPGNGKVQREEMPQL